jgi:hypothetical protein
MEKHITITLDTKDGHLIFDILGKTSASLGDIVEIPGNAKLIYDGTYTRKGFGFPDTLNFTLVFGMGVASSLVATWLYDKFKGKTEKVAINRAVIELDKGEIKRIIEEEIKKE